MRLASFPCPSFIAQCQSQSLLLYPTNLTFLLCPLAKVLYFSRPPLKGGHVRVTIYGGERCIYHLEEALEQVEHKDLHQHEEQEAPCPSSLPLGTPFTPSLRCTAHLHASSAGPRYPERFRYHQAAVDALPMAAVTRSSHQTEA